jgi:outer membrane protein TolC
LNRDRWYIRVFVCAVFAWLVLWMPVCAGATEPQSDKALEGDLGFSDAVRLALKQSPTFTQSQLEVEVHQLDESDAKMSYVPRLALSTAYYPDPPSGTNTLSAINFIIGPYNPVETYFTVKAAKLVTRAAVLQHQSNISRGIYQLADGYLRLEHLRRLSDLQDRTVELYSERLHFARKLQSLGEASEYDVAMAEQELDLAQAEREQLDAAGAALNEEIRIQLGLNVDQWVKLNTTQAKQQTLGDFNPDKVSFETVRRNSFDLKIRELENQLQAMQTPRAYARFLPTLSVGVRNPDPLGDTARNQEFYAFIGVNLVIWDGYKRVNDISRQALRDRQMESRTRVEKFDLRSEWLQLKRDLRKAEVILKLARSADKLAELKARKAEIDYQSSDYRITKSDLLNARAALVSASKKVGEAQLENDQVKLKMMHLAGELFRQHVKIVPSEDM